MSETLYDAPNQQVVRPDGSAPWDEGDGGSTNPAPEPQAEESGEQEEEGDELEAMTKDDLLAKAQQMGVSPANASMTKAELIAGIREAER